MRPGMGRFMRRGNGQPSDQAAVLGLPSWQLGHLRRWISLPFAASLQPQWVQAS